MKNYNEEEKRTILKETVNSKNVKEFHTLKVTI